MSTKKNQNYIVKCIKQVSGRKCLLGKRIFKVGDYVTYNGNPTKFINLAAIYIKGEEDFPFDELIGNLNLSDYFAPESVKVVKI